MCLVDDGTLVLDTTARSVLGDDLPLIADDVTVEHLLAHRSGIGDYLDEDETADVNSYMLPVPVHELDDDRAVPRGARRHPDRSPPGERFAYNNGGYVVLALIAERASGVPLPRARAASAVCEPAGMPTPAFLRSDELPGDAALGYLRADGLRTNVLHLPVLGTATAASTRPPPISRAFWEALFAGRIVASELVAEMVRPRSDWPEEDRRYGLGFHVHAHERRRVARGLRRGRVVHEYCTSTIAGHHATP